MADKKREPEGSFTLRAKQKDLKRWREVAAREGRTLSSWVRYWLTELAKKAAP